MVATPQGSAPLKSGENGKGIASRWYPTTLARRIRNLIPLHDRITFIEGDALAYLADHLYTRWRALHHLLSPYEARKHHGLGMPVSQK
jgi:hypothetical protein